MKAKAISKKKAKVSVLEKRNELFTFRYPFIHAHGRAAESYADKIKEALPNAGIEKSYIDYTSPIEKVDGNFVVKFHLSS